LLCGIINIHAKINWGSVVGATIFSTVVGIFFGLYPAKKAARLSPIEALRHE
jgi:putative ABC transport system permease protein